MLFLMFLPNKHFRNRMAITPFSYDKKQVKFAKFLSIYDQFTIKEKKSVLFISQKSDAIFFFSFPEFILLFW